MSEAIREHQGQPCRRFALWRAGSGSEVRYLATSAQGSNMLEALDPIGAKTFLDGEEVLRWFRGLTPSAKTEIKSRGYRLCYIATSAVGELHDLPITLPSKAEEVFA